jgi:hypothetical protein
MPPTQSSAWGPYLLLLSASPDFDAVVREPDIPTRPHFSSNIDLKCSKLVLFGSEGEQHALALSSQTSPDLLSSKIKGWRVIPTHCGGEYLGAMAASPAGKWTSA